MKTINVTNEDHKVIKDFADKKGCSIPGACHELLIAHNNGNPVAHNEQIEDVNSESSKQEGKKMGEPKDFCPECLKKDQAKEWAERDHKAVVEKLTAQASASESRAATAEKQVEQLGHAPEFDTFIEHCKTCPTHKAGLEAYNEKLLKDFVNNMDRNAATQLAKSKGVELMPDNIVIGTNLADKLR